MSSTALLEVQAQLISTLQGDAQLIALCPIFDLVPEGQARPYVEIAELEETANNVFGARGRDVTITLNIFDESPGFKLTEQIVDRLNALLDDAPLPDTANWHVFGYSLVILTFAKEMDTVEVRHVTARYLLQVESTS